MTNTELTKIREDKQLSKGDFAKLLGITPMLLGRYENGGLQIPEELAVKVKELSDAAAATEIEVKKTVRKGGRKAKEAATEATALAMEALEDQAAATEIEVKKTVRKAGRKAKEAADAIKESVKESVKESYGLPNIIIQSPMGGIITTEDIAKKVPKNTEDVYVRVDENKLYYVLKDGESGSVDIWE